MFLFIIQKTNEPVAQGISPNMPELVSISSNNGLWKLYFSLSFLSKCFLGHFTVHWVFCYLEATYAIYYD